MQIPEIFKRCEALTMFKRQDYTTNHNIDNHENFKRAEEIVSWFSNRRDKSYTALIGTKLARLGSLLSSERIPNNESIEDSFLDLINYCALWMERVSSESYVQTLNGMNLNNIIKDGNPSNEVKVGNITFTHVPESVKLYCDMVDMASKLDNYEISDMICHLTKIRESRTVTVPSPCNSERPSQTMREQQKEDSRDEILRKNFVDRGYPRS